VNKQKILVLVHMDLVPPPETQPKDVDRFATPWMTEFDVIHTLQQNGHEVKVCGVYDSLDELINVVKDFRPHIVFNLLEQYGEDITMDHNIVSLLEMLKVKYTGCNPKGLMLARDKALCKKILKHHHIGTPNFFVVPKNKKRKIPKTLKYPMIVKCLFEEASYGIAQASIVHSEEKLKERLEYINTKLEQDAIIEEFIEGKEIYVGVFGNIQLKTLPIWELKFTNVENPDKEIYSRRAKWNMKYRDRKGIETGKADLTKEQEEKIIKTCKKVYQILGLSGYARIDLRLTPDNKIYILEANPNPNVAWDDEFAKSAKSAGIQYPELLETLIKVGL
jgi:D-alanine-D-alanine ligase